MDVTMRLVMVTEYHELCVHNPTSAEIFLCHFRHELVGELGVSSGWKLSDMCPTKFFSDGRIRACALKLATIVALEVVLTPAEKKNAMMTVFLWAMSFA